MEKDLMERVGGMRKLNRTAIIRVHRIQIF
jgi:hypothetical protein